MLNKIRQLLLLDSKIKKLQNNHKNSYSFIILNAYLKLEKFIPLTNWTISPSALLHLLNYITIYRPKVIIEFGTGASTTYISELIKKNCLETKFYSVDHDEQWINTVRDTTSSDLVEFIYAPLNTKRVFENHNFYWYDEVEVLKKISKEEIDLVIIDGPPGMVKFSRAGAFQFFKDEIESESLVYFLDDTNREDEATIVSTLGKHNLMYSDYCIGGKKLNYDCEPIVHYN